MASNEFHFVTHWQVEGTIEEIADIIADPADLSRWWPSVYIDVKQLKPWDADGTGGEVSLFTTGWLPYTLRWSYRSSGWNYPHGGSIEAWGDFEGRGIWTFEQDGRWANVTFEWNILAEKPLLRSLSFILKPLFEANHRWAMAKGEESLRLELQRRHARTPGELALVPPPPGRTTTSPGLLLAGGGAALVAGLVLATALRRR